MSRVSAAETTCDEYRTLVYEYMCMDRSEPGPGQEDGAFWKIAHLNVQSSILTHGADLAGLGAPRPIPGNKGRTAQLSACTFVLSFFRFVSFGAGVRVVRPTSLFDTPWKHTIVRRMINHFPELQNGSGI